MKLYYSPVQIYDDFVGIIYDGQVFTGISFQDFQGTTITIQKEAYQLNTDTSQWETITPIYTLVCGEETNLASKWIELGGPVKGSYGINNG